MNDLISRQAVIDAIVAWTVEDRPDAEMPTDLVGRINALPSAQSGRLTDKEQRIFLAAMEREEKVCAEVDRNYVREPYEDSLMSVCRGIKRKVKGALWT